MTETKDQFRPGTTFFSGRRQYQFEPEYLVKILVGVETEEPSFLEPGKYNKIDNVLELHMIHQSWRVFIPGPFPSRPSGRYLTAPSTLQATKRAAINIIERTGSWGRLQRLLKGGS